MLEFRRYSNSGWISESGNNPAEMAVLLTVNGDPWLEFMCTPEYLEALAIGFLLNEGQIEKLDDIVQLRVCPSGDNVDVWTEQALKKPVRWRTTSGCSGGVTTNGIDMKLQRIKIPDLPNGLTFHLKENSLTVQRINELVFLLYRAQKLHHQSGGIHASALSDGHSLQLFCEDIGRHNTLDKLAGRALLEKIEAPRIVILTTGRISSEMIQKTARMKVPFVLSLTSPTSLAISMADHWGMTLIGYAHGQDFKVYSHPERIEV
jgi:FdhD protein